MVSSARFVCQTQDIYANSLKPGKLSREDCLFVDTGLQRK